MHVSMYVGDEGVLNYQFLLLMYNITEEQLIPQNFIFSPNTAPIASTDSIVLNEDEGMVIKPLEEVSMHFTVDTKLIMEIESMNDEAA